MRTLGQTIRRVSIVVVAGILLAYPRPTLASADACATEKAEIARLQIQLRRHIQAVRQLGMQTTADTAEQWQEITEADRQNARRAFFDGVQDSTFAVAEGTVQVLGSLNPWSVNKAIGRLRAGGLSTPAIEAALREIARLPGKPALRSGIKLKLKVLESAVERARWDAASTPLETKLDVLKHVLGFGLGPQGGLVVGGAEFLLSLAYSGHAQVVARPAIDRMTKLSHEQQQNLVRIAAMIQATVRALREHRAALANCARRQPSPSVQCTPANAQRFAGEAKKLCATSVGAIDITEECLEGYARFASAMNNWCACVGGPTTYGVGDNPGPSTIMRVLSPPGYTKELCRTH